MTACGAPGFPSIYKSLMKNAERKIEVIGTDMNKNAVGFLMLEKSYIVPSGLSEDFISTMLEIAEKENIDVIMPLATFELMALRRIRKNLKRSERRCLYLIQRHWRQRIIRACCMHSCEKKDYWRHDR